MVRALRTTIILAALLLLCTVGRSPAQELNCVVTLNVQTLSDQERLVWDSFKSDVEAYLNTFSWTTNYSGQKIQCSMGFNITGSNGSEYSAELLVMSTRYIGGTRQVTTMARFFDNNVSFGYTRGMPLQHGINYRELESILDYYANVIIGLDMDSYSDQGGTIAFQQAQQAALVGNAAQGTGWDRIITASGAFSRFGYADDITSAQTRPLRSFWYQYHTGVLDLSLTDTDAARANFAQIVDSLISIMRQNSDVDRSVYYKTVCNAKYTEFADFGRWFTDNLGLYFRKIKYIDRSHISFYEDAETKLNAAGGQ